jgi:aryl-alcohol dehydrogenase-like predicted oxidoreductase
MEYRRLGTSDVNVSAICLGSMTWGMQNSEAEGHAQLDRAFDVHGINFIDTAETYPVPPTRETQGRSEEVIGSWLKRRPDLRGKVVIASKVMGMNNAVPHIRDGRGGLDRKAILEAIDGSLRRLGVDCIDLYQTHSPDRWVNAFGRLGYTHDPSKDGATLEETLGVMADLMRAGKIRHFGVSNETPWGVHRHFMLAETRGMPRAMSVQNPYSLLNRLYEIGMAEISIRERCGLLAYSPLAMGILSGKYLGGVRPAGARHTLYDRFKRYWVARQEPATKAYVELARDAGLDASQMALAFVTSRPFVTSTIIGATTMAQLDSDAKSIAVKLSEDVLARIAAIHEAMPNPVP